MVVRPLSPLLECFQFLNWDVPLPAELLVRQLEGLVELKVVQLLLQDVTSGPDHLVVVVVKDQWKKPLLLQLAVQVALKVRDLGFKTGKRPRKKVRNKLYLTASGCLGAS